VTFPQTENLSLCVSRIYSGGICFDDQQPIYSGRLSNLYSNDRKTALRIGFLAASTNMNISPKTYFIKNHSQVSTTGLKGEQRGRFSLIDDF